MFATLPSLPTIGLALGAVLGLIWLAAILARRGLGSAWTGARRGASAAGSALLVREATLALDPRRRVHLLRCAGGQVVLLTGGPQDLLLGWLPPATPALGPRATETAAHPAPGPAAGMDACGR